MGSDLGARKGYSWRGAETHRLLVLSFFAGMVLSMILHRIVVQQQTNSSTDCAVYLGKYHGDEYRSSSTVGRPNCLVESKFLKVQQHTVQMPGSGLIDDWLFIDYHERINVLVEAPRKPNHVDEPHFLVFEQTKYALEDRMSLAIVGGIIEPGESPEQTAQREVSEELHVVCQEFHFLGRYRTDVNRGEGWTSTFLARDCEPGTLGQSKHGKEQVGAADTERQDVRTMSLTELRKAVTAGKFLEIQWSATVALALMHPSLSPVT